MFKSGRNKINEHTTQKLLVILENVKPNQPTIYGLCLVFSWYLSSESCQRGVPAADSMGVKPSQTYVEVCVCVCVCVCVGAQGVVLKGQRPVLLDWV